MEPRQKFKLLRYRQPYQGGGEGGGDEAEGAGAGAQEVGGGVNLDAGGGVDAQHGQRRAHRLDVAAAKVEFESKIEAILKAVHHILCFKR